MMHEDIIRMMRESGLKVDDTNPPDAIERFVAIIAAAEREACADICERRKSLYWMEFDKTGSDAERSAAIASEECATAICARGESK